MGKSVPLFSLLLVTILVLLGSTDHNKLVVMANECNEVLYEYTCEHEGIDKRCAAECCDKFPGSKSVCEAPPGVPAGVFFCRCKYSC